MRWSCDQLGSRGVDGEHTDIVPIEVEGAFAGREQRTRIANVQVKFLRRLVFARFLEKIQSLAEGALSTRSVISLVLKKVPCEVPFARVIEPTTSVTNQWLWA